MADSRLELGHWRAVRWCIASALSEEEHRWQFFVQWVARVDFRASVPPRSAAPKAMVAAVFFFLACFFCRILQMKYRMPIAGRPPRPPRSSET